MNGNTEDTDIADVKDDFSKHNLSSQCKVAMQLIFQDLQQIASPFQ